MSTLDEIRKRLPMPANFGADAPYARFNRVQADRSAGEDITLEFQSAEGHDAPALVVFSHSEWRDTPSGMRTRPLCTATIDVHSGEVRADSKQAAAEIEAGIREALMHADQMELAG